MSESTTSGRIVVFVAVTCAVLMTAMTAKREFSSPSQGISKSGTDTLPKPIDNWQDYAIGHRMGPNNARVTMTLFEDFECPACRVFTLGALRAVRTVYPKDIAVVFRHLPLSYHRFAYQTARASECAAAQDRFEAFHDVAYLKQDSLGLKLPWSYAHEAGVPDSVAFATCMAQTDRLPLIIADSVAAIKLGSRGTPTVMVNGYLVRGAPDSARLVNMIKGILESQ